MARVPDPEFQQWLEAARAYPIAEVAAERGLRLSRGAEPRGPCPDCGGYDRFNLNLKLGRFFCRHCTPSGGNVIDLVILIDRCDFLRACEMLTGHAPPGGGGRGLTPAEAVAVEAERQARRAEQDAAEERRLSRKRHGYLRQWRAALPAHGSPVERYLALRRLTLPASARLRYQPDAELWADLKGGPSLIHRGPAMLAAIQGPDGLFSGLHKTWIDLARPDGKAHAPDPETGEFLPAKKTYGSPRAGRIELVRHEAPRRLLIGEGNETVLSVRDDLLDAGVDVSDAAFWSAISLGNLGGRAEASIRHPTQLTPGGRPVRVPGPVPTDIGIPIPDSVEEIVILGDGDSEPFLTANAIERARRRWSRPGRTVLAAMAPEGQDFNDMRRGRP